MTDLEAYAKAEGRDELVRMVRAKIDELGITYIYYQFASVTGRIVGKGIPADHWESAAERGFQLVYGATANLFLDRRSNYIGYGPEASELVGIPDPETFVQLPWDRRVGRVFCTLFRNREEPTDPGTVPDLGLPRELEADPRAVPGQPQGAPPPPRHRAGDDVVEERSGRQAGRRVQQAVLLPHRPVRVAPTGSPEGHRVRPGDGPRHDPGRPRRLAGPARAELDVRRGATHLRSADNVSPDLRQVAREFDLIACFMCKPFMGVSASGCHHNISLWRGGEDAVNPLRQDPLPGMEGSFLYRKGGENTFMPLPDAHKPGPIGLHCIGGIIDHLPALTAIGCSTVNSYRRLWDKGFWAPVYADWGYQNRACGLRVSAHGRFEYRAVDAMVNPYLMATALLKSCDDGIRRKLDPGEPEQRNIYQAMEAGKQVRKLPMSLGDALDSLEQDEVIKSALPGGDVPGIHALQAGRVGTVPGDRHRMGSRDLFGLLAIGARRHVRYCGYHPPGEGSRHRR